MFEENGLSSRTLVLAKNNTIIAASRDQNIIELDNELNIIKTHRGTRDSNQPSAMHANEEYLVVGYSHVHDKDGGDGDRRRSSIKIKGRCIDGRGLQVSEVMFSPN